MLATQVELESKPCPICSKFDDEVILTGRDRLHRFLDNFIASIGYFLQDRGYKNQWTQTLIDSASRSGKKQYWLYPLAYPLSILGQTGRMTVWAKKIND